MVDSHCHLDFESYENNLDEVILDSISNGVNKIINPGSSVERSQQAFLISQKYENVYFACGSHPEEIQGTGISTQETGIRRQESVLSTQEIRAGAQYSGDRNQETHLHSNLDGIIKEIDQVFPKLLESRKCVAIGEVGLDYHYSTQYSGNSTQLKYDRSQQDLFIYQLELAKKYGKPVIIHNRESKDDLYSILKQYNLSGVVHCYSEDKQFAKKILDLGFYISFTGNITFKNVKDYIIDAIKYIPVDRLLCETDGPFLAPQQFRGQINYPKYVKFVYDKISEIKGIEFKKFESQIKENVFNLFRI